MPLNPKELREKNVKELLDQLKELQSQMLKLRAEARLGTLKNTAAIRNTRKDIARILIVLAEKKQGKTEQATSQSSSKQEAKQ
ncbi:50S ribosomal protein L29 [Sulfolobus sp. SCGC AB-777_G06]|jgi:large subunit ribosomal protein L29|uniref:50S ribosomal protein L29 n=1 Tax=Stygiolobus sp. CP850M TaxID=3133134 RepID=UPI000D580EAA|nr:50S ribosomal protein L29 [Sulfolobaceae archaeon]PVU75127.1 50S ribosomal protein L29 [Sulfolobus sp. SCGC AB-777_G06]